METPSNTCGDTPLPSSEPRRVTRAMIVASMEEEDERYWRWWMAAPDVHPDLNTRMFDDWREAVEETSYLFMDRRIWLMWRLFGKTGSQTIQAMIGRRLKRHQEKHFIGQIRRDHRYGTP